MNGFTLGLLAGFMLNTKTGKKFMDNFETKIQEIVKAATDQEEPKNEQQEDSGNAIEG